MVPAQTPLWQSVAAAQWARSGHLGQAPPPQSRSVSGPFFTVSVHEGTWHTWFSQTPLLQSVAASQPLPSSHLSQVSPPQSTSVSSAFSTASVQVGRQIVPEHFPPMQSASM